VRAPARRELFDVATPGRERLQGEPDIPGATTTRSCSGFSTCDNSPKGEAASGGMAEATKPGSSIASHEAGLREEALGREGHPLHPYTCPDCGRPVRALDQDRRCDPCAGVVPEVNAERLREARRQLHRDAALLLRKAGYPERAAWHDAAAER